MEAARVEWWERVKPQHTRNWKHRTYCVTG
jgi:hypothetical protein